MKNRDNTGWFFVLPATLVLGLIGLIPLMTIVNYAFFEIFILDKRFWVGTEWYQDIIRSGRFWASFGRSSLFSVLILSIQIPLGIAIALCIPRRTVWVGITLAVIALPLLVPWNMIPSLWLSLLNPDTGLIGRILPDANTWKMSAPQTWLVIIAMDVWHWTSLVAILLRFMDSFMIYTEAFPINAGGPNAATLFLAVDLGEDIKAFNYGPSAARSVLYFLIVLTVAWVFSRAQSRLDRQ